MDKSDKKLQKIWWSNQFWDLTALEELRSKAEPRMKGSITRRINEHLGEPKPKSQKAARAQTINWAIRMLLGAKSNIQRQKYLLGRSLNVNPEMHDAYFQGETAQIEMSQAIVHMDNALDQLRSMNVILSAKDKKDATPGRDDSIS